MNNIYVVTAYRYGDHEKHSYVIGAFSTIEKAEYAAKGEERYRGGKYSCDIVEMPVDKMFKEWEESDEVW